MRPDQATKIIIRPYVTEKTFDAIEGLNRLTFLVHGNSNKHSIKLAIKTLYDVEVETVNTQCLYGMSKPEQTTFKKLIIQIRNNIAGN